jgi:hypothetical protein
LFPLAIPQICNLMVETDPSKKRHLTSWVIISIVGALAVAAAIGTRSSGLFKDEPNPKIELATPENTYGAKPMAVVGAGGGGRKSPPPAHP